MNDRVEGRAGFWIAAMIAIAVSALVSLVRLVV